MARAGQVKAGPKGRRAAAWPWADRARHQAGAFGTILLQHCDRSIDNPFLIEVEPGSAIRVW